MDESGEQFVAYCLPTEETLMKRRRDVQENMIYLDDDTYEYKMAREYNWNVKSKASKGYEENYFLVSFTNTYFSHVWKLKKKQITWPAYDSPLVVLV